jgi:hypothetical protein
MQVPLHMVHRVPSNPGKLSSWLSYKDEAAEARQQAVMISKRAVCQKMNAISLCSREMQTRCGMFQCYTVSATTLQVLLRSWPLLCTSAVAGAYIKFWLMFETKMVAKKGAVFFAPFIGGQWCTQVHNKRSPKRSGGTCHEAKSVNCMSVKAFGQSRPLRRISIV